MMSPAAGRKSKRHGIAHTLNVMVCGHSSAGKTSFLRTLAASLAGKEHARWVKTADVSPSATPPHSGPSSPMGSQLSLNGISLADNMHVLFHPFYRNQMNPGLQPDIVEPSSLPGYIEFNNLDDERIRLTLIDTPGLPIPVNVHKHQNMAMETRGIHPQPIQNTPSSPIMSKEELNAIGNDWIRIICKYMDSSFEKTLLEESKVRRNPKTPDHHVHACVYLLDPLIVDACKGLTVIDHVALKALCTRVNVIPVFAKSDLLTVQQTERVRRWIIEDIQRNEIPIQYFEDEVEDRDTSLRQVYPLSLFNSEEEQDGEIGITDEHGIFFLGRLYRWGKVKVENPEHCDFLKLKEILFTTHLQEFKSVTKEQLYERWRTEKLLQVRESVLAGRPSLKSQTDNSMLLFQKTAERVLDK